LAFVHGHTNSRPGVAEGDDLLETNTFCRRLCGVKYAALDIRTQRLLRLGHATDDMYASDLFLLRKMSEVDGVEIELSFK
jgi:hypothetical protein